MCDLICDVTSLVVVFKAATWVKSMCENQKKERKYRNQSKFFLHKCLSKNGLGMEFTAC